MSDDAADCTTNKPSYQVESGAYSGGGAPEFYNFKRQSTVTQHSNRKRDKEEELRRKKKRNISLLEL